MKPTFVRQLIFYVLVFFCIFYFSFSFFPSKFFQILFSPLMLGLFLSQQDINTLKRQSPRQLSLRLIAASYSVISTYMLWKLIGLFLSNDSPIVVVLSESMYPGFERGDILFLSPKNYDDYVVGDMTVFQMNKKEIPIVHRAIKRFDERILSQMPIKAKQETNKSHS